MAETVIIKRRGNPGIAYDVVTGTTTITISDANVTADSSNITLSPLHSETPKLIGLTLETVAGTGTPTRDATSVEVKTLSSTTLAFTGKVATAPGGGKTVVLTVRYTLAGKCEGNI